MPHPSFVRSAHALDDKRLGKQRVEAYQIMKALADPDYGWQKHPAVQMWRGYEDALVEYGATCCMVWVLRGFQDTLLARFAERSWPRPYRTPPWLGDTEFHRSHQSNLVRKDAAHYQPQFPDVPDNLPYVWPPNDEYRI
jgi:hypothetical protein